MQHSGSLKLLNTKNSSSTSSTFFCRLHHHCITSIGTNHTQWLRNQQAHLTGSRHLRDPSILSSSSRASTDTTLRISMSSTTTWRNSSMTARTISWPTSLFSNCKLTSENSSAFFGTWKYHRRIQTYTTIMLVKLLQVHAAASTSRSTHQSGYTAFGDVKGMKFLQHRRGYGRIFQDDHFITKMQCDWLFGSEAPDSR